MTIDSRNIVLGETREVVLDVTVANLGEPSYVTSVLIEPSANTAYRGFTQDLSQDIERVSCSRVQNTTSIQCDFQQPLLSVRGGMFKLRFDVSQERLFPQGTQLSALNTMVQINATVRNTEEGAMEQNMNNNYAAQSASVSLKSDLSIIGWGFMLQTPFPMNSLI